MLNYFLKVARLLHVEVRIRTQVCFDSKLNLHWLDSICAVIYGEESQIGPRHVTVGKGCVATPLSAVSHLYISGSWFSPFLLLQQKGCVSLSWTVSWSSSIFLSLFAPSVSVLPRPWPLPPTLKPAWSCVCVSACRGPKPTGFPTCLCSSFFKTRLPEWVLCVDLFPFSPNPLWFCPYQSLRVVPALHVFLPPSPGNRHPTVYFCTFDYFRCLIE